MRIKKHNNVIVFDYNGTLLATKSFTRLFYYLKKIIFFKIFIKSLQDFRNILFQYFNNF